MTKQDKEYWELLIERIATKTVEKMTDKLPCHENIEKINEHETILNNGLRDDVRQIRKWIWGLIGIFVTYGIVDKLHIF